MSYQSANVSKTEAELQQIKARLAMWFRMFICLSISLSDQILPTHPLRNNHDCWADNCTCVKNSSWITGNKSFGIASEMCNLSWPFHTHDFWAAHTILSNTFFTKFLPSKNCLPPNFLFLPSLIFGISRGFILFWHVGEKCLNYTSKICQTLPADHTRHNATLHSTST